MVMLALVYLPPGLTPPVWLVMLSLLGLLLLSDRFYDLMRRHRVVVGVGAAVATWAASRFVMLQCFCGWTWGGFVWW